MKKIFTLALSFGMALLSYSQTFINEDFSTFTGGTPPLNSGWKNVDSLNVPAQPDSLWRFDNPGGQTLSPPISGNAAIIDSDYYGPNPNPGTLMQDAYLQSPNFDASLATAVTMEFDHYHRPLSNIADLEVFDGTNWVIVASYGAGTSNPAHEVVDLTQYVAGVSNAQVRFHYTGSYSWYWIVDNINIYQPIPDDVAAISVDSLVNGCGLSSAETVALRFTNVGSTPVQNIPVEYSVNGGTPVSEIYTDTLFPGDTAIHSFATKANFSTVGTYTITASTNLRGDANPVNDTAQGTAVNIPILSSFPYSEGFENGNGGWTSGGLSNSWALGTPAGSVINSAASGTQAWATNLTGIYNANEGSFVQGPCFDFTNLAAPQIKMNIWFASESNYDGAALQTSVDGGATWQTVGAFGDPNNWYNDNSINGLQSMNGNPDGWSSTGTGWVLAEHDLTGLGGVSGVLIRIAFGSDGSVQQEGFAFDDVLIQNAPASDAGIASIDGPNSGCGLGTDSVKITIFNAGSTFLNSIPVSYSVNGATAVNEVYTDTLFPGDTASYTFLTTVNLSAVGTYNITSYTAVAGDGNLLNDTTSIAVTNIPILTTYPYSEGFENGNGGWTTGGANSSWALGTPANTVINTAATGSQAWVTNLSGQYNSNEQSFVQGPCFDFTNLAAPQIKMNVWWESEAGWDGAVLQSSIDGGATWQNVGAFGDPNNWYNQANLNAQPGGSSEGWGGRTSSSNGSGTWLLAEHNLSGLAGISGVLIRIAFAGDGSVQDEGFAFDDVLVQDAPANDANLIRFDNLNSGCGLGMDSIRVLIANAGSAVIDSIPVSYVINSGTPVNEMVLDSILPGDTINYVFQTVANFSVPNTYNIESYISLPGDGNLLNDSISTSITHFAAGTVPYSENFDALSTGSTSGLLANNWLISNNGGHTWTTNSGGTSSTNTGPIGDASSTGSGVYLFTETSGSVSGSTTTLTSSCLDFGSGSRSGITLEYKYHMYGADMGTLNVQLDSMGTWITVDAIVGQQQAVQTDPWATRVVNLNNYTSFGATAIRFEAIALGGYNGDLAIDEISIFEPTAADAGVVAIDSLSSRCGLGNEKVCVRITNFGTAAISNFPVAYTINNGTPVVETISSTILPGDTLSYCFTALANLSAPGAYSFDSYTSLTGDGNPLNDTIQNILITNTLIAVPTVVNFDNLSSGSFGAFSNGWTGTPTTGFRFQANSGSTSSSSTGPAGDTTGSGAGIYMYGEASSGVVGDTAFLVSPCVDINNTIDPTLIFAYHMYGATIGELHVQINNGNGWLTLDTIFGQQQIASTDPWLYDTLNLNAYKNGSQASLRFFIVKGSSYTGDIAIDDVRMISLPVGINTKEVVLNSINIYPNPSNGIFNIDIPSYLNSVVNLKITDITGGVVYENIISKNSSNNNFQIDLSGLAKGVYLFNLSNGVSVKTEKLIIK